MIFYVILEDIQQKHRFFLSFSSAFSKKHMGFSWPFHRFPPFLGQIFSSSPTGQTGLRQRTGHRLHPSPGLKVQCGKGTSLVFFWGGFSPGFFLGFFGIFFGCPWKMTWKMTWKRWNGRNGLLDEFWTIPGSLDGRTSGVSAGVFVAFQLWFWMVYESTTPVVPMIQVADRRWPDGHFTALAERILTQTW